MCSTRSRRQYRSTSNLPKSEVTLGPSEQAKEQSRSWRSEQRSGREDLSKHSDPRANQNSARGPNVVRALVGPKPLERLEE
eukprot:3742581-Prymnesium_polylepis.2